MVTIFKGTPLVLAADDGDTMQLADADGVYTKQLYVDGTGYAAQLTVGGAGYGINCEGAVRGTTVGIDSWYDNTIQNINAAADTVLMANALHDNPADSFISITYAAGLFTFHRELNVQVFFQTTALTSNAQAIIEFEINGIKRRRFYTNYVPGSADFNPILCEYAFHVDDGSTFRIVSTPVVNPTLNIGGTDSNANSQTTLRFCFHGL